MFNPEVSDLKRRYNVLLEQYQKLQGSIRVLQSTMEEMTSSLERTEHERDKYKKAFEEIFTNNIGDEWERLPDEEKKSMSIDNKLSFFENEINASKLYIRRQMLLQMQSTAEENQTLHEQVVQLEARLTEKDEQLKHAAILSSQQPVIKNPTNSLLGDDEVGRQSNKTGDSVAPKKNGVFSKIGNVLGEFAGMEVPGTSSGKGSSHKSPTTIIPPAKNTSVTKPMVSTPISTPTSQNIAPTAPSQTQTKPPVKTTPATAPSTTPSTVSENKPLPQKQPEGKTSANSKPQTTGFFNTFNRFPPNVQAQIKGKRAAWDKELENIRENAKEVLLVIGKSGVYNVDDIYDEGVCRKYWEESETAKNRIRRAFPKLINAGFLVKGAKAPSIGRGNPKDSYLLSQNGIVWFALTTLDDPLTSLAIVRAKEQKSVEHAELIQKMISILKDNGFETAQEVAIKSKEYGEDSVADISAHKNGNNNIRIECEMGNYTTDKYVYKFAKALDVSDRLLVGVPNNTTKEKIKEAVDELIREKFRGLENFRQAGKEYIVFTLDELSRNPDIILPKQKGNRW